MADPQRRLRSVDLFKSHQVLAKFLKGPEILEMTEEKTAEMFAVYVSLLPVRRERLTRLPPPGNLKRQAYYQVRRGGFGPEKDRWIGYVGNFADYAAYVEYGKNGSPGQHALARAAEICGYNAGGRGRAAGGTKKRVQKIRKLKKENPTKFSTAERRAHLRKVSLEERRAKRNQIRQARKEQGQKRLRENIEKYRAIGESNKEAKAERKRLKEEARDPRKRYERERGKSTIRPEDAGSREESTAEKVERFFKLAQSQDKKDQKEAFKLRKEIEREKEVAAARGGDERTAEERYEALREELDRTGRLPTALEKRLLREFE